MSSAAVEQPVKMPNHGGGGNKRRPSNFSAISQKKFKYDRGRKRSKSFSGCGPGKIKNLKPVLPTKFLLGGNINDPLNLNSLQDEEVNRAMNAVTPKSSPIPTPPRRKGQIEVIIPPNINDPLNLIGCADEAEFEQQLCSPVKKGRKKRPRKRRTMSATVVCAETEVADAAPTQPADDETAAPPPPEARTPESLNDSAKIPDISVETCASRDLSLELTSPRKEGNNNCSGTNTNANGSSNNCNNKNKRKSDDHKENAKKMKYSMDKIVSPVIPQPGAWLKRTANNVVKHHRPARQPVDQNKLPVFKEKNKQYQYGNYNRYYGYRNPHNEVDPRLRCFAYHSDLFVGKDILDIGCNIGHVTLSVARDFGARSVVGLDIDKTLIGIARKNIKHYVSSVSPTRNNYFGSGANNDIDDKDTDTNMKSSELYPISMPILYGPIDIPGFNERRKGRGFPHNVTFVQGNYVLDDDSLITMEQPQFDVILCLSVTKWIHLNWGDNGVKQAFRRMYAQLRPGGKLIMEPQNWASYKAKKKLTETIYKNYNSIELFPDKFTQFLLSPEIGFAKSENLGFPHHHHHHHHHNHQSKGFQRPIHVYTKSTMYPSERVEGSTREQPGSEEHHQHGGGGAASAGRPTNVYTYPPTLLGSGEYYNAGSFNGTTNCDDTVHREAAHDNTAHQSVETRSDCKSDTGGGSAV